MKVSLVALAALVATAASDRVRQAPEHRLEEVSVERMALLECQGEKWRDSCLTKTGREWMKTM